MVESFVLHLILESKLIPFSQMKLPGIHYSRRIHPGP